jgi:hypothetical protein
MRPLHRGSVWHRLTLRENVRLGPVVAAAGVSGVKAHTVRAVLTVLLEHADHAGICWPSVETIARESEVSAASVKRAIDVLARSGILRRHGQPGAGRGNSARTRLLWDVLDDLAGITSIEPTAAEIRAASKGRPAKRLRSKTVQDEPYVPKMGQGEPLSPENGSGCAPKTVQGEPQTIHHENHAPARTHAKGVRAGEGEPEPTVEPLPAVERLRTPGAPARAVLPRGLSMLEALERIAMIEAQEHPDRAEKREAEQILRDIAHRQALAKDTADAQERATRLAKRFGWGDPATAPPAASDALEAIPLAPAGSDVAGDGADAGEAPVEGGADGVGVVEGGRGGVGVGPGGDADAGEPVSVPVVDEAIEGAEFGQPPEGPVGP